MNYRITVPSKLNFNNIESLVVSFEKYKSDIHENPQIIFDLSNLERIDTEGLNYIALLPFQLKLLNENIIIVLPTNNDIILFLDYTNLLRFFFENFNVHGYRCIEDLMFLRKRIKSKNPYKKVRIGLVKSNSFDSFLRNELSNLERIIDNKYSKYFCMCFYELTKNIFEHSGENIGGFSFHLRTKDKYDSKNDTLVLSISDIGYGIKKTLIDNLELPKDKPDTFYLEQAIKKGVTSTKNSSRGLGLYHVVDFSSEVQITSGHGQIKVKDGHIKNCIYTKFNLSGTSIHMKLDL